MRASANQYNEVDTAKSTVLVAKPTSPHSNTFLRPKRVHAIDSSGDTKSDAALYEPTSKPRLLWLMPLLRAY
jgi:hypothetical protein